MTGYIIAGLLVALVAVLAFGGMAFSAEKRRHEKAESNIRKEHEDYVQERDKKERERNEQKESIETGNGTDDFLAGVMLLHDGKGSAAK